MKKLPFAMKKKSKMLHTSLSSRVHFKGKVSPEKDLIRNCFSGASSRRTGDKKYKAKSQSKEETEPCLNTERAPDVLHECVSSVMTSSRRKIGHRHATLWTPGHIINIEFFNFFGT